MSGPSQARTVLATAPVLSPLVDEPTAARAAVEACPLPNTPVLCTCMGTFLSSTRHDHVVGILTNAALRLLAAQAMGDVRPDIPTACPADLPSDVPKSTNALERKGRVRS